MFLEVFVLGWSILQANLCCFQMSWLRSASKNMMWNKNSTITASHYLTFDSWTKINHILKGLGQHTAYFLLIPLNICFIKNSLGGFYFAPLLCYRVNHDFSDFSPYSVSPQCPPSKPHALELDRFHLLFICFSLTPEECFQIPIWI